MTLWILDSIANWAVFLWSWREVHFRSSIIAEALDFLLYRHKMKRNCSKLDGLNVVDMLLGVWVPDCTCILKSWANIWLVGQLLNLPGAVSTLSCRRNHYNGLTSPTVTVHSVSDSWRSLNFSDQEIHMNWSYLSNSAFHVRFMNESHIFPSRKQLSMGLTSLIAHSVSDSWVSIFPLGNPQLVLLL